MMPPKRNLNLIIFMLVIILLFSAYEYEFVDFLIGEYGHYFYQENSVRVSYNSDGSQTIHCKATIVTAYFKMKSKHSLQEYEDWMSNMLSLHDCMVIFTPKDTVRLDSNLSFNNS